MANTPPAIIPQGEPEVRRKFQLTNLQGNNNKYYLVDIWTLSNDQIFFRATYGRVGAAPQVDEKVTTPHWVERKIREKLAKGYQEVMLHRQEVVVTAPATAAPVDPKVQELVNLVYDEAGKQIASFLAVDVGALSLQQIAQGRSLLVAAQRQYMAWRLTHWSRTFESLADTVQSFYNAVPTQLSARIEREQVVLDFCGQLAEHEDRLKQLEAAVATAMARQRNPQVSLYDALGADVAPLPQNDRRYQDVCDYIKRTVVHSYKVRVRDVFSVTVPEERRAFEQNTQGRSQVALLFHGTASQNVRHILRSGLICPRLPSNGRMFGDGIYFANKCTKSANYCSVSKRDRPYMLFLADVAVGKPFVANEAMPSIQAPPAGYDSVWGKAGHTGSWGSKLQYDEHIVYNSAQQTLRYLVTFDR
jgi:poly [ADP-ribose] polymerase